MKLKTALSACCISGCLFILILPLLVYYYFANKSDTPAVVKETPLTEIAGKEILMNIVMASDMESDFNGLKEFVGVVNKLNPDLVFILGDITVLGVQEDFLKTRDILKDIEAETFFIPGDRDLWKSRGVSNFKSVFGNNYQLIERQGVKFLLIDNSNEYEGIDKPQMDFIESEIGEADYVMFHNPIFFNSSVLGIMGKGMGQYSGTVDDQRKVLLNLIHNTDVVKGTFAGDQHYFSVSEDTEKSGLYHVVVGSLSSNRNLDAPNFSVVKIYKDKTFSAEKYYLFEPFEIEKQP